MRSLLVPYDGSEPSRGAFAIACQIAERSGAEVVVAHSVEIPPLALTAPSLGDSIEQLLNEGEKHWRGELGALVGEAPDGVSVRAEVLTGSVVNALGELIDAERPDLVLAGTRGVGGAHRVLMGRVSQRLLETCKQPILFVREHAEGLSASTNRILVAVDGSKDSEAALAVAVKLAAALGFELKLANVIDPFLPGWGVPDLESVREDFRSYARTVLDEAREKIDPALGLEISDEIYEGRPGDELSEACASDSSVALAVCGTRGIQGFSGLFVGSVARDLVNHAQVPVMVVRQPADD